MKMKYILHFVKCKILFIGCQLFLEFFKKMLNFFAFLPVMPAQSLHRCKLKIEIFSLFWNSWLFLLWAVPRFPAWIQKFGIISAFSQRFFPNTIAKISDTRSCRYKVLCEVIWSKCAKAGLFVKRCIRPIITLKIPLKNLISAFCCLSR